MNFTFARALERFWYWPVSGAAVVLLFNSSSFFSDQLSFFLLVFGGGLVGLWICLDTCSLAKRSKAMRVGVVLAYVFAAMLGVILADALGSWFLPS